MVLPELRALANEVGVKGASGMRKSELIAAIRERRGEPAASSTHAGCPRTPAADNDKGSAAADTTTDNGMPAELASSRAQQRRERRGASRDAGFCR